MAYESIEAIKKAEAQAQEIIRNAQEESKSIIKNVNLKGEEEYKKIINDSKLKSIEIINKAIEEGEKQSLPILENGKRHIESIFEVSKERRDEAINLVIERIVNINGDS